MANMMTRTKLAAALATTLFLAGCGSDLPRTYPVSGTVTLSGGDAAQLAGHHVEVVSESDPNNRAGEGDPPADGVGPREVGTAAGEEQGRRQRRGEFGSRVHVFPRVG